MLGHLNDRMRGGLALFAASGIYASFGPLIRVLSEMFGTYAQVAARMGVALVLLLIAALLFGWVKKITGKQMLWAVFLGIATTGIVVFFTMSVTEIRIATAVFLCYAASIISSLIFGTVFFKESINAQKVIALILAFTGLFLFGDVVLTLSLGVVAGLLSGVCEGIGNGIRKALSGADRTTVLLYQLFVNTSLASLLMLLVGEPAIREVGASPMVAVVVFAILLLVLNHLLLFGFQHFDVNIATVILALELFFASLFGYFFYGEALSANEILGGVAIFVASVVSVWEFGKGAGR